MDQVSARGAADRAYLAVVQWPEGWSEETRGQLLSHAAQMDLYNAQLAANRGTPGVVAVLEPEAADAALGYLRERGVMANAFKRSEMLELPRPDAIKRLFWAEQGGQRVLGAERWRGTPGEVFFEPSELFLVIRALTKSTERRVSTDRGGRSGAMIAGFMVGGMAGAAIGGVMAGGNSTSVSSRSQTSEAMDIYTRSANGEMQRFRVQSGRFDASILGEQRGVSAKEYMQGIVALINKLNPRVIVDTGFDDFRAPPDAIKTHFTAVGGSAVNRTSNAGSFEFYSEWACMLYRSMLA